MAMDRFTTWVGVGLKGGGMLGFVGFETLDGRIWNLSGLQKNDFTIGALRLGVGLGGGFGMVAIFVFDCLNINDLNGKDLSNYNAKPGDPPASTGITDVNINVSLGEKWADLGKLLTNKHFAKIAAAIAKAKFKLPPDGLDHLRNAGHHVYNVYDFKASSGPKVIVVEIPTAGMGVEVSAYIAKGQFSVSEPK